MNMNIIKINTTEENKKKLDIGDFNLMSPIRRDIIKDTKNKEFLKFSFLLHNTANSQKFIYEFYMPIYFNNKINDYVPVSFLRDSKMYAYAKAFAYLNPRFSSVYDIMNVRQVDFLKEIFLRNDINEIVAYSNPEIQKSLYTFRFQKMELTYYKNTKTSTIIPLVDECIDKK